MSREGNYGQILKSSSIIGAASIINILVGLLRTKVAAVLLRPAGVGLIELFQILMATASTASGGKWGQSTFRDALPMAQGRKKYSDPIFRRLLIW